jgi:N6-L-threonylcarbamoyladenine synthase
MSGVGGARSGAGHGEGHGEGRGGGHGAGGTRKRGGLILAVESSCDETGIALLEDGRTIHANVVASQVAMHAAMGGIVPEVAARAHLRWIVPVFDEAWAAATEAGITWDDISAVAVTNGPGLAGSLLVGINFAKTLAYVHGKPLVPVNHLEGHLYAAWLADDAREPAEPIFPLVALIVSGGHTFLVEMRDHLTYRLLGETVDDAAGEAFDKVGRLLGLPYPGGPAIMKAAAGATAKNVVFPRAWQGDTFDFSFSGLKTAARRTIATETGGAGTTTGETPLSEDRVAELAYGFQESVVDVLVTKTIRAAEAIGARSIVLGGGVAANRVLRDRLAARGAAAGMPLVVPRPALCTDNGAMIGAAAARRFEAGVRAGLDLDARPSMPLAKR